MRIAKEVKEAGGCMLRGGAYKPRTSPYSFQGMGLEGLKCMYKAKQAYNMPIVSELMSEKKLDEFEEYVDLIQVGARNMQNFDLLKALGKSCLLYTSCCLQFFVQTTITTGIFCDHIISIDLL